MAVISALKIDHKEINEAIREVQGDVRITDCMGQRFIGAGMKSRNITIEGVPGNALGAYLDGAEIEVFANAQDAVGDTMNAGKIVIHGSIGDAAGYAMRGGKLFIRDNAGYRAGIHMKEYSGKVPVIVIGGTAGSFLGEYQAGGIIVVLGRNAGKRKIISNFPCTGMHGGKLFIRGNAEGLRFPHNVCVRTAQEADMEILKPILEE